MPNQLMIEFSGPRITADKFAHGVRHFLNFINELGKEVTGQSKAARWTVTAKQGSIGLVLKPFDTPAKIVDSLLNAIGNGVEVINAKATRPKYFSDNVLNEINELTSVIDSRRAEVDKIRIWTNTRTNTLSTRTMANVDSILGPHYEGPGSVEGRLETITERRGLRFVVYQSINDRPVNCYFDEQLISQITVAFGKRIYVRGIVRYRRSGEPISIKVEEFRVFPDSTGLPQFKDVLGIMRG